MHGNFKDIPKRYPSSTSSAAYQDQTDPLRSLTRAKITPIAEDPEFCSSTSGSSPALPVPETESSNSECCSTPADVESGGCIQSAYPEPVSSKLQPTDNTESTTDERFFSALNDRHPQAKRVIPQRSVLESPSPSPEPAGNSSANRAADDIADTESTGTSCEAGSSSSNSRAFSPDRESLSNMPDISPTWPVNTCGSETGRPEYDVPEKLKEIGERNPLFCCGDLHIHLRTNPIMPKKLEEIHSPIINVFVASIGPDFEEMAYISETELNAINRIIKVNRVGAGVEISTFLFAINEKESTFMRFLDSDYIMPFNPQGKGSYQSYYCPAHRNMYRIGIYDRKYSYLKKRASFGDVIMDYSMGLLTDSSYRAEATMSLVQTFAADHDQHDE